VTALRCPHLLAVLTFWVTGPNDGNMRRHVHIHVLPRQLGDFEPMDDVYDALDEAEIDLHPPEGRAPATLTKKLDSDRVARSKEDMFQEAADFRRLFA